MNHDFVLLVVTLSENYVEPHFIKMEHHHIMSFLFVRGFKKIFLVGGLGVEDQPNGLSEVAFSHHVTSFRVFRLKRKQKEVKISLLKPSVDKESFKVEVLQHMNVTHRTFREIFSSYGSVLSTYDPITHMFAALHTKHQTIPNKDYIRPADLL
jgi:hypothetical protein